MKSTRAVNIRRSSHGETPARDTAQSRHPATTRDQGADMLKFLLWLILFVLCRPLALVAALRYPPVWLLMLPFPPVVVVLGGTIWASRIT